MQQLVIVGAGPTGASLALMLVQRGIPVKLIEAARNFQRSLRGEALMPSGLMALYAMGLDNVVEAIPHCPLASWEFWIEGRLVFRVDEPMSPDALPCTLVSQSALLEAIISRASQYPNFELIQGLPVKDLCWENDRVAGVRLLDGTEQTADLVIGADGRNSIVRKQAGLLLQSESQNFNILWFKLEAGALFQDRAVFCSIVQDGQAFGIFRSADGALQVGWSIDDNDSDWKQTDWKQKLIASSPEWLSQHFQTYANSLEPPTLLSVMVGQCQQWHRPGVIVLGDAAHPMSPIRAQGINMALRDTLVATNYLVPALAIDHATVDMALAQVQAVRTPEIIRVQALQAAEIHDAEKLRRYPWLRQIVSRAPQAIRHLIKVKWLLRQQKMRGGLNQVELTI
jgi:2-polyprenyl-6-methoxyphenol hydroxylase-like FAD-dependent oxidoreductase